MHQICEFTSQLFKILNSPKILKIIFKQMLNL